MISRSSHLLSIDEAGEPCQWLLPRAADTHQQGTATGIGGDATNTSTHVARGTWHNTQHAQHTWENIENTHVSQNFGHIISTSLSSLPTCFSHPKTKRIEADRGGSRHDRRAAPHRRKAQDSWWRARCCKRQALPAKKNRRISTRSLQAKQKIFSVDSHLHHVPNLLHVPSRQIKPLSTRSLTTEFIRTRNRQNCLKGLLNIVDDIVILPREWSSYMYGPYGPYGLYGPLRALRALTDRMGPIRALRDLQAPSNSPETDFTIHVEVISLFLPLLALEIRHRQELKILCGPLRQFTVPNQKSLGKKLPSYRALNTAK